MNHEQFELGSYKLYSSLVCLLTSQIQTPILARTPFFFIGGGMGIGLLIICLQLLEICEFDLGMHFMFAN